MIGGVYFGQYWMGGTVVVSPAVPDVQLFAGDRSQSRADAITSPSRVGVLTSPSRGVADTSPSRSATVTSPKRTAN